MNCVGLWLLLHVSWGLITACRLAKEGSFITCRECQSPSAAKLQHKCLVSP